MSGEIRGPSVLEKNKETQVHSNTASSYHHQNKSSSLSPSAHNHHHHQRAKSNNSRQATQGEKIQHLKHQIEKQMKAYVKQEEYEEMLKLIKQLNLISADKWQELENEVDKLDYSDVEYKSTRGFVTDDEIAILASDINAPYNANINEIIELTRHNSEIRQSTPLIKQNIMTISKNNNDDENMKETKFIELNKNNNNIENKPNYAFKRSILRKLMIAQRQKFLMKKEQVDFNKMKNNFADTSISNFSQASGFVNCNGEKSAKYNAGTDQNDQSENVK